MRGIILFNSHELTVAAFGTVNLFILDRKNFARLRDSGSETSICIVNTFLK